MTNGNNGKGDLVVRGPQNLRERTSKPVDVSLHTSPEVMVLF